MCGGSRKHASRAVQRALNPWLRAEPGFDLERNGYVLPKYSERCRAGRTAGGVGMEHRAGLLITLLLLAIAGVIVFYIMGGSIDIDADIRTPQVEVDPGALPDVNVDRGGRAEAGDQD
jgi:hypothetical protein